jgi:DNA-binding MarR family transcriptional regulator
MSSPTTKRGEPGGAARPLAGALLRLAWYAARERVLEVAADAGYADLTAVHLAVLHYPPPDGARPVELAARAHMPRQSINYILAELEKLGYVERRSPNGGSRRLVYLTERGHRVVAVIRGAMAQLERDWALRVGRRRYDEFIEVLKALARSSI